jgi:hypothetical protein
VTACWPPRPCAANLVTSDANAWPANCRQNPTIASLRGPDGKLDMDRYRQLVASQGMTPEMFEADVRRDVSLRQVMAGVAGSGLASAGRPMWRSVPSSKSARSRSHALPRPTTLRGQPDRC